MVSSAICTFPPWPMAATACFAVAPLNSLRVLGDAWPRAFFFRGAEGQAANARISYED